MPHPPSPQLLRRNREEREHGTGSTVYYQLTGRLSLKPWDIEGKWSVSPDGWSEEARKPALMRKKIAIRDDTFRKGTIASDIE